MRPACYLLLLFVSACAPMPALAATNQAGQAAQTSHPSNEQAAQVSPKSSGRAPVAQLPAVRAGTAQAPTVQAPDPWTMLMNGANSQKLRDRSDAIGALSVLSSDRKAIAVIAN